MTPPRRLVILLSSLMILLGTVTHAQNDGIVNVSVLGLGAMGSAVVKCLASNEIMVHGWNRGVENREKLRSTQLSNVVIHDSALDAIMASNIIMIIINSKPHLETVKELILSPAHWTNKTLINFVNQDPLSTLEFQDFLDKEDYSVNHVAGQLFAVPPMICSAGALILASSNEEHVFQQPETTQALQALGTVKTFDTNVAHAPLVIVGLIQTLYFGITGFELGWLLLEKFDVPDTDRSLYTELAQTVVVGQYMTMFVSSIGASVAKKDFAKGVPARPLLELLEMHQEFIHKMKIDYVFEKYVSTLRRMVGKTPGASHSAIIEEYSTDSFSVFSEKKDEL